MAVFPFPKFDEPPVIEVVCGVLFDTATTIMAPHVGVFWQSVRDEFPLLEEAPPLSPVVEQFQPSGIQVQFTTQPPIPRTWFQSEDKRTLVQLQRDRFLYNWKRVDDEATYPSFSEVYNRFSQHFGGFTKFIDEMALGPMTCSQFELTYVNHIPWHGGWETIGEVLKDHVVNSTSRFLPPQEAFQWKTQFILPDQAGRLHVNAQSAIRLGENGGPVLRLDLTARGMGDDKTTEGMKNWFELAHEWIVKGFVDITVEAMHHQWKRTQ